MTAAVRLTRTPAPSGHYIEVLIAKRGNDQEQTVIVAFHATRLTLARAAQHPYPTSDTPIELALIEFGRVLVKDERHRGLERR